MNTERLQEIKEEHDNLIITLKSLGKFKPYCELSQKEDFTLSEVMRKIQSRIYDLEYQVLEIMFETSYIQSDKEAEESIPFQEYG
jgi:uncharacterized coiled-coil DUF342 family protein